jgi:hypothetical protein
MSTFSQKSEVQQKKGGGIEDGGARERDKERERGIERIPSCETRWTYAY